jgi:hypothetical protein
MQAYTKAIPESTPERPKTDSSAASPGEMRNVTALGIVSFFTDFSTKMVLGVIPNRTWQKCSQCGDAKEKLDLSVSESYSCGLVLDRDINAARNILKLGLDQIHAERQNRYLSCSG